MAKDYEIRRFIPTDNMHGDRISIHDDGRYVRFRHSGDAYDHDMFLRFQEATTALIDWTEDPIKTRPKCLAHLDHSRHRCPRYGMDYHGCRYTFQDKYHLDDHAEFYRAYDRSRIMISHPYSKHRSGEAEQLAAADHSVIVQPMGRDLSWYFPHKSNMVVAGRWHIVADLMQVCDSLRTGEDSDTYWDRRTPGYRHPALDIPYDDSRDK